METSMKTNRETILPISTLILANQSIWLFDLKLHAANRGERHIFLDKLLKGFFTQKITQAAQNNSHCWQNFSQFCHIIHTPGQPAQAVFKEKNGQEIILPLAISYALPYVAVAVNFDSQLDNSSLDNENLEKIGLDMCAVADFENMAMAEKQHFCQDYFPYLPMTQDSKALARRWSAFEATLKYHRLPLETAVQNPFFQQTLPPLSVQSDKVYLDDQAFWLSVAVA